MNILITGGIGRIGRFVVAHLLSEGHGVRILDREDTAHIPSDVSSFIQGADYHQVDVTRYEDIRLYFEGVDAVVHLAAIPYPIPGQDPAIFNINCSGTFNVYQAAAAAGIRRVVSASSINALGNCFGVRPIPIYYLPMDEDHPTWTSDVYSFSKQVVEETATYFWRRSEISGVCMRFPFVNTPDWSPEDERAAYFKNVRREFDLLLAMSETERQEAIDTMQAQLSALSQQLRRGDIARKEVFQKMLAVPYRAILVGRNDFWAILDVRDAAHAVHLALTADYEGSHVLNIADCVNATGIPTADLVNLFYPDVTVWKNPVSGTGTIYSIDKARDLIGYAPRYSLGLQ